MSSIVRPLGNLARDSISFNHSRSRVYNPRFIDGRANAAPILACDPDSIRFLIPIFHEIYDQMPPLEPWGFRAVYSEGQHISIEPVRYRLSLRVPQGPDEFCSADRTALVNQLASLVVNFQIPLLDCSRCIETKLFVLMNEFAEGKSRAITCVAYGKADGLIISECNGGFQPAGARTRDGRLWFPTQGGVAIINPEEITVNSEPPPVVIETCIIDRAAVSISSRVRISPGQRYLEIHYTGLSFIKSEHMRFKYRLKGLDNEWVEAGPRRTAYYSHLPPGEYNFTVIAANSDGVWNNQGASLQLLVVPPFYRTRWFISSITLGLIAVASFAYERRIRQLKRAKTAQEAFSRQLIDSQESDRKRIAAELHDGLGQSLALIKDRALVGLQAPSDPGSVESSIYTVALR